MFAYFLLLLFICFSFPPNTELKSKPKSLTTSTLNSSWSSFLKWEKPLTTSTLLATLPCSLILSQWKMISVWIFICTTMLTLFSCRSETGLFVSMLVLSCLWIWTKWRVLSNQVSLTWRLIWSNSLWMVMSTLALIVTTKFFILVKWMLAPRLLINLSNSQRTTRWAPKHFYSDSPCSKTTLLWGRPMRSLLKWSLVVSKCWCVVILF